MPKGLLPKLSAYTQKITRRLLRWYINPIVAQQNEYNAAVTEVLANLCRQVDEHTGGLAAVQRQEERQEQDLETLRLRLQRTENWRRDSQLSAPPATPPPAPAAIDYFLLAAQHRNTVQMAERLRDYDDVWAALLQARQADPSRALPVLDLGCGRGELVADLRQMGIAAYGLDLDDDALNIGRELGLDLRQEDAAAHLAGLPDGSLAGVVMIQVIEHFAPEALLGLLKLIERKVMRGGVVVAETLNPACVYALSNWFLMDPSHKMPVHPMTARFLLEQAGFHRIEVRYMHPVPDEQRLQPIDGGAPRETLQGKLAVDIERLNEFLYGPQDYAVIALKPDS